ncbi:hypothetical protein AX16_000477 [Volvariella volvacea WC 439]|nr:hypothetical protein AX16_000477 [Volvariella volvacea WC 439]
MDLSQTTSPVLGTFSSRSRSSTNLRLTIDDVTSLTSFNPFSEEDENDQSSYTLVTSIFSRVKNTLSAPLSSAVAVTSSNPTNTTAQPNNVNGSNTEPRRPPYNSVPTQTSVTSRTSSGDRPNPLFPPVAVAAPPLVSLKLAQPEVTIYNPETDRSPSRNGGGWSPMVEYGGGEGAFMSTSIPGFPIQDDARSIKTTTSVHRSGSVSKVFRRLRREGLSRDYWMDDENSKECYDCKSTFTTWRRKHHCRICGQIFCSRCASNIIKGSRFGHDGMLRVCNLCLERLAKVDEDDDDRGSVISSVTSFPVPFVMEPISHSVGRFPQSPFSSQVFGEPYNPYSFSEPKRPLGTPTEIKIGLPSRSDSFDAGLWEPLAANPAPFRRDMNDEDKLIGHISSEAFPTSASPTTTGYKPSLSFPISIPVNKELMSTIQFPVGSPEHVMDSPHSFSRPGMGYYGEVDATTPFIRSRVHSRLDSLPGDIGWRTRRESMAYAQELNHASMNHLKIMLRQMLNIEQIPNVDQWEETLLKLALRIARELTFTALPHRQGEDMDVRRYVKIKKIPGGMPKDSEYVDGAVITKNVAHKQMSRSISNPRIMLVGFPLEYYRSETQYVNFSQIVLQEKEYLNNLASRIAAHRPHVVLVEKSVSSLALNALAKHKIVVARTVKHSAITTVGRMTQCDMVSSIDKLAREPRLGNCAKFRIQTFDHPLIPGRRKTYMRFEGCNQDMGCTIVLRGADIDTLRRLKKVTRFLAFVVRNLKLETHLWIDSAIGLPAFNSDAVPASMVPLLKKREDSTPSTSTNPPGLLMKADTPDSESVATPVVQPIPLVEEQEDDEAHDEDAEQLRLSNRINESLEPYAKTFISVSSALRFPPPYPIKRMKELDNQLLDARRTWEDEIVRKEESSLISHQQEGTVTTSTATSATESNRSTSESNPSIPPAPKVDTLTSDPPITAEELNAQIEALPALDIPLTPLIGETPLADESSNHELEQSSVSTSSVSTSAQVSGSGLSSLTSSYVEEAKKVIKDVSEIACQSRYHILKWQHEEQRRIWEWYQRKNRDDFVVEKYQCISVWEFTVPSIESSTRQRPCFAPQMNYITFYGENDYTLGQYIERSLAKNISSEQVMCTGKGCDQPISQHGLVFAHNETELHVAVEAWDGKIPGIFPEQGSLAFYWSWSECRLCGKPITGGVVSAEMQRYSFAKFLELFFYPADVDLTQGTGCEHNIFKHHARYFVMTNVSKMKKVRFQTESIAVQEIVYPPFRIHVRQDGQLLLKNADFLRLHQRNLAWYSGLISDLKLIGIESATGDEVADGKLLAEVNELIARAECEQEDISRMINKIYRESAPTDTLALNVVHPYLQDRIVAWQSDFDKLPKPRPADAKRIAGFSSVRAIWPRRSDIRGALENAPWPSTSVSEAEEGLIKARRPTADSFISSASEAESDVGSTEKKVPLPLLPPSEAEKSASDAESDSTIGAPREDATLPKAPISPPPPPPPQLEQVDEVKLDEIAKEDEDDEDNDNERTTLAPSQALEELKPITLPRPSRLPRRSLHRPSVAELVKKYQDFLPPQGVHDLAKTALSPRTTMMSESEQEYASPATARRLPVRSRNTQHLLSKKASNSDFEHSYALNVAPRYLTHPRKASGHHTSRIPGPRVTLESRFSSRMPSPEKRIYSGRAREMRLNENSPPESVADGPSERLTKSRVVGSKGKEKASLRPSNTIKASGTRKVTGGTGGKVSTLAKQFERLGRETDRPSRRYTVLRGRRARPVANARPRVEILESVQDVLKDESESSDSSSEADDEGEGEEERPPVPEIQHTFTEDSRPPSPKPPPEDTPPVTESPAEEIPPPIDETKLQPPPPVNNVNPAVPPSPFLAVIQQQNETLSELFNQPASRFSVDSQTNRSTRFSLDIDDPMNDPVHIFRDSTMVVRTDEPTSIIALALSSSQYRDMLARSRAEKRTVVREAKLEERTHLSDAISVTDSTSSGWGFVNVDTTDTVDPTEDLRMPSSRSPWLISVESGGLTISCTILFPEQFDALRRTYDCEHSMIESLSRCVKWNASGGKSGSAFLKTRDDRFIAKELSRAELQTMETFAPAYFDYLSSAVSASRPTLLAKIFGCFKVTFKKSKGSGRFKSTQMNLLVMENLFYDRQFTKIFDLKGSTRNRHVQATGRVNEVLLDENLVQSAHLHPFYLREHSKRILRGALHNDSKFLADINVMDYSLVCGVDSGKNDLVVGIVDYVRTYTWDKKLESWVKESAFLGGTTKGEPTIVTPRQYRSRFLAAMERYFPLIPDRWMKQKDAPEEEPNMLSDLWPDYW